MTIKDEATELALKTWYPPDHPLHSQAHHPLGKLLGEWGELLDDYMKLLYKPGYEAKFKAKFLDELGDIWYYIRILCYQRSYQPIELDLSAHSTDKLIALVIQEVSTEFISCLNIDAYSLFCLDVSYSALLVLLDRQDTTLDELTELNWQKLRPGSKRGEQWMKARKTA